MLTTGARGRPAEARRKPRQHRRARRRTGGEAGQGRDILTRALEADLQKLAETRADIDRLVADRSRRSPKAAKPCRRALQADLQKVAEGRAEFDDVVAGHVARLAEGRDMLAQALDEDLGKLAEARREIDAAIAGHIDTIAGKRIVISEAVAADVEKIEEAFRRQTGIIEERTGTMERALSIGVDNVRQVLEKSAVVVAGALREKVLEVTAALNEEAGKAFTDADRRIAERAEQTSSALLARAEDIARSSRKPTAARRLRRAPSEDGRRHVRPRRGDRPHFDEADQRLVARAMETAGSLAARAGDILRNFDDADQRLGVRIGESAEALAARAAELGRSSTAADEKLVARIAEAPRSSEPAPGSSAVFDAADQRIARGLPTSAARSAPMPARSSSTSRTPTSGWPRVSAKPPRRWLGARPRSAASSRSPTGRSRRASTRPPRRSRRGLSKSAASSRSRPAACRTDQRKLGHDRRACRGIADAFAETEQRVVARAQQTSTELDARARAIEETLRRGAAHEKLAAGAAGGRGSRVNAPGGRGCRKPPRLQRRGHGPEAQRADQAGRSAARVARQRDRRDLHGGRPAYRPEHQRGGAHHRRQHARAELDAGRAVGRDHPHSRRDGAAAGRTLGGGRQRAGRRASTRRRRAAERLRAENAALVNALANRTAETLSAVEGARVNARRRRVRPDREARRFELAARRADRAAAGKTSPLSTSG